jgi:putative sterol carrier protein
VSHARHVGRGGGLVGIRSRLEGMSLVSEFFEKLPSRVDPGKTAGMNNSYVFDIEGAGTWTVRVSDAGVTVEDGDNGGDCTLVASAETFEKVVKGEQNATVAYMSGKLKIKGDMGAAMKLQKLF